tara:strand:+ start:1764 stop:1931 length:168 start_codon:yes stop_codon:yes gene_type:complete
MIDLPSISPLGLLFFGFIIVSYFVGMWVGMKIKEPKIIIREEKSQRRPDYGTRRR